MSGDSITRRDLLALALGAALVPRRAAADRAGSPVSAALLQRPIPRTGELVPALGMGTWQTFDVGDDRGARARLTDVLRVFSAAGGRVIDSSPMYGSSETVYGDLAAELGLAGRMFVATKVWTRGRDAGIRQMRESMARMRADPVDLMQVHNLVDLETHLVTLREWRAAGRLRYLGVTHYRESAHDELARLLTRESLDAIQINYSIGERGAEQRLLPLARDRGVAVLVNRPFGGGDLFSRVRGRPLPGWASEYGIASWAQLLLKFVLAHPAVTCAIPATSNPAHMADNLGAAVGPLPDEAGRRRMAALLD